MALRTQRVLPRQPSANRKANHKKDMARAFVLDRIGQRNNTV